MADLPNAYAFEADVPVVAFSPIATELEYCAFALLPKAKAFVAFVPALGVCAAFIGSRSSAKKGEEEKEARPVFKGTLKSVSIEEKVKQATT